MRHRSVLAIFATVLVLVIPGTASGETTDFNAAIEGKIQKPDGGCPGGARRCGDAAIDGFGPAEYEFFVTSAHPISDACVAYTGITTFTLEDGSVLTLDEVGTACGPGNSFFNGGGRSWGNPDDVNGTWDVQSGTGQFEGMTGEGSGSTHSAGSHFRGTYTGTLNS
jgi:hypothetical protein